MAGPIPFEEIAANKVHLRGTVGSRITELESGDMKAEGDIIEAISLDTLRIHDAFNSFLPSTSSSNDLGLYPGTFGTDGMLVRTADLKNAGSTTNYARFLCVVPPRYEAASSFKIRFYAGMETTVASSAATIDLEAYRLDGEGGISADLCATAAQSINSTSYANKDFTITSATLSAGDVLDCRVTVVVNDSGTVNPVIGSIGKIQKVLTMRG